MCKFRVTVHIVRILMRLLLLSQWDQQLPIEIQFGCLRLNYPNLKISWTQTLIISAQCDLIKVHKTMTVTHRG